MKVLIVVLFLLLYPHDGYVQAGEPAVTKHYEESLSKITDQGHFGIEMIVKGQNLEMGVNELDLIIHDKDDKDVAGAEITVVPWMPDMNHGVSIKPVVTERGGGIYSVGDIILVMTGHWQLRISVKKGDLQDSATFDFPDVMISGHQHGMKHEMARKDLDTSTVRVSENKLFRVSYESDRDPMSINRFHRVTLKIETSGGTPVKNAQITLVGDMPEHGHGLPTKPEVTSELGNGKYLVEGVKFNMPGWWVVTFHIKAGDKQDSVSFNLNLR